MRSQITNRRRTRRGLRIERLEARQVLASSGGEGLGTGTGRVWHDADADGIQDSGESGQNSVEVTLFSTDLRQSGRQRLPKLQRVFRRRGVASVFPSF